MTVVLPPEYQSHASVINMTNLLMRETTHRLTTVPVAYHEPNPELYVVTIVDWRNRERPILSQSYLDFCLILRFSAVPEECPPRCTLKVGKVWWSISPLKRRYQRFLRGLKRLCNTSNEQ